MVALFAALDVALFLDQGTQLLAQLAHAAVLGGAEKLVVVFGLGFHAVGQLCFTTGKKILRS